MGLIAISRPVAKPWMLPFISSNSVRVMFSVRRAVSKSNRGSVRCPLPRRPFAPRQTNRRETRTWTASLLRFPRLPASSFRNALLVLHRHAKGDALFAFAHLAFEFQPAAIGIEWSRLQVTAMALRQSEQGIPKRVVMESGVSGEKFSRRVDRAVQQFSPSCMFLRYSSLLFLLFPFFERFCCSKKRSKFPS